MIKKSLRYPDDGRRLHEAAPSPSRGAATDLSPPAQAVGSKARRTTQPRRGVRIRLPGGTTCSVRGRTCRTMKAAAAGAKRRRSRCRYNEPVRRRLVNFLTALSLVLCMATAALWVRSYWVTDEVSQGEAQRQIVVSSSAGVFSAELHDRWEDSTPSRMAWVHEMRSNMALLVAVPSGERWWNRLGFSAGREIVELDLMPVTVRLHRITWLTIPCAAVVAPLAVLPALRLRRWRLDRRRREDCAGLCPACGYDLRATPERCPECGTVPAAAQLPKDERAS